MFIQKENKLRYVNGDIEAIKYELPAGLYDYITVTNIFAPNEYYFKKNETFTKGFKINVGTYKEVDHDVDAFLDENTLQASKLIGIKNRFSAILNGIPGTGKTFLAGQQAQKLIEKYNAVGVIINQRSDFKAIVDQIREKDKDRFVILIFDEFEKWWKTCDESELLSFLDGKDSPDNMILFATTNSMKGFPDTLLNRPGRFEKKYNFNELLPEVIEGTITSILPEEYKTPDLITKCITAFTDNVNKTIDQLRLIVRDNLALVLKKEKETVTVLDEQVCPN